MATAKFRSLKRSVRTCALGSRATPGPSVGGQGAQLSSNGRFMLDACDDALLRRRPKPDDTAIPRTDMLRDDRGNGGGRRLTPRNVLGEPLEICSIKPMTGFYRDGCCNTGREDVGSHTVCVVMTSSFSIFPNRAATIFRHQCRNFGFPGLKPGDRWCLCAPRWQEAFEANQAPRVVLRATHEGALAYCSLADLKRFAVDLS